MPGLLVLTAVQCFPTTSEMLMTSIFFVLKVYIDWTCSLPFLMNVCFLPFTLNFTYGGFH